MEIKDLTTPIILVATIISSHWLASKQARKAKKAKWIEDFRLAMSKFFALSILLKKNDTNSLIDFSSSTWTIIMLLDDYDPTHVMLITEIGYFGIFMSERFDANHVNEYKDKVQIIKDLAKAVIRVEEQKI